MNLILFSKSIISIGKDNYFNNKLSIISDPNVGVLIGSNGLFSTGISIRNSDAHLIYDVDTMERISKDRSVVIGDHVWLGQDCKILKGTSIGSGSIVGAGSLVSGKRIVSNSTWGGNPAKLIKKGVFFTGESTHRMSGERRKAVEHSSSEKYIFSKDQHNINFVRRFNEILLLSDINDKVKELIELSELDKYKNRFYLD